MCSPAALAHHSFAMFDLEKEVTVEAVVKELQYQNPHVWIQIMVPDGHGGETEWSIEGGAPGMMTRAGWKSSTLKAGAGTLVMVRSRRRAAASSAPFRWPGPWARAGGAPATDDRPGACQVSRPRPIDNRSGKGGHR
jgi:hypothetical protein